MEDLVAEKRIKTVVSLLAKNEKLRRLYLAAEAESLGWGGMVYVSKIAGVDKDTVTAGKKDLEKLRQNHETQCSDSIDDSESPIKERIRAEGGGRKSIVDTQPGIIEALLKLIDGSEYAILTTAIYKEWSGMTASEYKAYKNIRKENSFFHLVFS